MSYPERHHPVFFLEDALRTLGVEATFARDERTEGCWGLIVNGRVVSYLIDNRWPHEREHEDPAAERLLSKGALVCCAQKEDAERIGGKWLPLAATPGYCPLDVPKAYDAAFVGYVRDPARSTLLIDVAAHCNLFVGENLFADAAVSAYCVAKVGVNIPTRYGDPNGYDINMRVFEIAATGTPLLTNHLSALADLGFEDGVNCYLYESADELVHAIGYAATWADEERIGAKALALVRDRHTYAHRAQQVLTWLQ